MPLLRSLAGSMVSRALAAFACVACVACSSGEDQGSSGRSSSSGGSGGACASDTRKDTFTAGIAKQGAGVSVKILEATPAPPAKGTNVMTLQILDAAGKPLDGASVQVSPFMPDHGHGSAVTPVITPAGSDGRYAVDKVYLAMAGLWTLTVRVTPAGGAPNEVVFSFCLDG